METKICSKCKVEKPLDEYHKDKRARDGRYSHCKACHYQMTHAYEQSDRGKEVVKGSVEKRREQIRERVRRWDASPERRAQRAEYAKSEAGKAAQRRKDAKRKAKAGYKVRAKDAVNNAIQAGRIPPISTQVCAVCGVPAEEYHHESYERNDWLAVTPLCKKHHAETYTNPH